jgi:predicted short-subunit dehydrogenase-like oxidoreductase (DUF2520 family)
MKNCHFIGTGKLGLNLAYALKSHDLINIGSILNRNFEHSLQAVKKIGQGRAVSELNNIQPGDVVFICTPDDTLENIVDQLLQTRCLASHCFVIHCSGALSSSILAPLKSITCHTASMHPLKSFSNFNEDSYILNDVGVIIEGDNDVCYWLNSILCQVNANVLSINSQAKALYHSAATIASNYLITLAETAKQLFEKAGIDNKQINPLIVSLMQGCINNIKQSDTPAQALTGPISRGDSNTIKLHLQAIDDQLIKEMYQVLGKRTLDFSILSEEQKNIINQLLID